MNLYIVVEGEKTEVLLYPKWINYIVPKLTQVFFEKDVTNDNYFLFSGGGIPSIYNTIINAIKDINDNPIYDMLIVCLDGEEIGVRERINEIESFIANSGVFINDKCSIEFVIQNICIETWFLGNRKIVKKIPENLKLREFLSHYNVKENDPELMEKMDGYRNRAHFHYSYFREILKEHNLSYIKSRPKEVLDNSFIDELIKRTTETAHLPSLKSFFDILMELKELIK